MAHPRPTAESLETPTSAQTALSLWVVADAAHHIDGHNVGSDLGSLEHLALTSLVEPSCNACDSWQRWREDLVLGTRTELHRRRLMATDGHRARRQHGRRRASACGIWLPRCRAMPAARPSALKCSVASTGACSTTSSSAAARRHLHPPRKPPDVKSHFDRFRETLRTWLGCSRQSFGARVLYDWGLSGCLMIDSTTPVPSTFTAQPDNAREGHSP